MKEAPPARSWRASLDAARVLDPRDSSQALDETLGSARFEAAADHVLMPARAPSATPGSAARSRLPGACRQPRHSQADGHGVRGGRQRRWGAPVLVGLGPKARHELGALAFAVTARRAGLPVLYLGPDLPVASWVAAATGRLRRAAVIGVPTRSDVRSAVAVLSALREAAPSMVLAVGGDEAARIAGEPGCDRVAGPRLPEAVTMLREAIALETRRLSGRLSPRQLDAGGSSVLGQLLERGGVIGRGHSRPITGSRRVGVGPQQLLSRRSAIAPGIGPPPDVDRNCQRGWIAVDLLAAGSVSARSVRSGGSATLRGGSLSRPASCQDLPSVAIDGAMTISTSCISRIVRAPSAAIDWRRAPTRFRGAVCRLRRAEQDLLERQALADPDPSAAKERR